MHLILARVACVMPARRSRFLAPLSLPASSLPPVLCSQLFWILCRTYVRPSSTSCLPPAIPVTTAAASGPRHGVFRAPTRLGRRRRPGPAAQHAPLPARCRGRQWRRQRHDQRQGSAARAVQRLRRRRAGNGAPPRRRAEEPAAAERGPAGHGAVPQERGRRALHPLPLPLPLPLGLPREARRRR